MPELISKQKAKEILDIKDDKTLRKIVNKYGIRFCILSNRLKRYYKIDVERMIDKRTV